MAVQFVDPSKQGRHMFNAENPVQNVVGMVYCGPPKNYNKEFGCHGRAIHTEILTEIQNVLHLECMVLMTF